MPPHEYLCLIMFLSSTLIFSTTSTPLPSTSPPRTTPPRTTPRLPAQKTLLRHGFLLLLKISPFPPIRARETSGEKGFPHFSRSTLGIKIAFKTGNENTHLPPAYSGGRAGPAPVQHEKQSVFLCTARGETDQTVEEPTPPLRQFWHRNPLLARQFLPSGARYGTICIR